MDPRYRKKVEKDEDFIRTLAVLGSAVEGLIKQVWPQTAARLEVSLLFGCQACTRTANETVFNFALPCLVPSPTLQNNAVDIYEEYFADCGADHSAEPPSSAIVTVFKDPHSRPGAPRRAANCVNWHSEGASKVGFSPGPRLPCLSPTFLEWPARQHQSCIWPLLGTKYVLLPCTPRPPRLAPIRWWWRTPSWASSSSSLEWRSAATCLMCPAPTRLSASWWE
jgi:hypothetical protein